MPGLAITAEFGLLLMSLATFIGYIGHIAQAIRPETIIESTAIDAIALIGKLEPFDTEDSDDGSRSNDDGRPHRRDDRPQR